MLKNIAIFGDEGGQVTQALMRVDGRPQRPQCAKLSVGGPACLNDVCEESNSSCLGTRVMDYQKSGVDRSSWGDLKVSPNPFLGKAENNLGS